MVITLHAVSEIDPFDELFGDGVTPAPKPRRTRASSRAAAQQLEQQISLKAAASGRGLADVGGVQALRRPVTITTLATIFEMDPQTITKRLVECPFISQSGRKLYDFKVACSYIIKPRMTPEQFVKTLNSSHLPPEVNKAFWDSQRSRVKYKIEAQEAWETHEVNAALGAICKTVKEALSTITEDMRDRARLTDEQVVLFDGAIEDLRHRLAEKLEELATKTVATSLFGKPLFGAPGVSTEPAFDDEYEDDEEPERAVLVRWSRIDRQPSIPSAT